jgi:hypothetical protein
MSWFNPKTQGVINNTLNTLQIWFGSGSNATNNTGTTPAPITDGVLTTSGGENSPKSRPTDDDKKKKTMTYIAIGAGVIIVGLTAFVIIKKSKKQ